MNKNYLLLTLFSIVFQSNILTAQTGKIQKNFRIDTIVFSGDRLEIHPIIDSILEEIPNIHESNSIKNKIDYALNRINGFKKDLSKKLFNSVSFMAVSFIERFEPIKDNDYMGIYELQFPSAQKANMAIKKFYLYNDFMSEYEYPFFHDWVYIRSNDKIFIIENPLADANKVLKCELYEALKKHIIIDDFDQRKNRGGKNEFFCW